jgi:peptidyl-prolyl cis-trans isomerase SurA
MGNRFLLSLVLSAALFGTFTARAESVIDEIVATVNGNPIMLSEIRAMLKGHVEVSSRKDLLPRTPGGAALDHAILKRLIEAEATARRISVVDAEVSDYIAKIKETNEFDDARLTEELRKNSKTMSQYKEEIRLDILKSKLAGSFARDTMSVSSEEVEEYLSTHSSHPSKVHLIKISLPPEKFSKELVEQVQIKMDEGASVKQIERELNVKDISSDFGFVSDHDLAPAIAKQIRTLKKGDYTEVIQGESTWDFYGVLEKSEPEPYTDAEYEEARQALKKSKFEDSIMDFFLKELPKKYPVDRMQ